MLVLSMPQRASSVEYDTASASIAALAAKYGTRNGGVPPRVDDEPTHAALLPRAEARRFATRRRCAMSGTIYAPVVSVSSTRSGPLTLPGDNGRSRSKFSHSLVQTLLGRGRRTHPILLLPHHVVHHFLLHPKVLVSHVLPLPKLFGRQL
jgi:hypothetical protein